MRMLAAAGAPQRRRPGLAERDQLVLLALVTTGIRRAELLALDWADLDLESDRPSLHVRHGTGGRPRRRPLPASEPWEPAALRTTVVAIKHSPSRADRPGADQAALSAFSQPTFGLLSGTLWIMRS